MPRGLKPSTMKAAHGFEKTFKNTKWIFVAAVIFALGFMLYLDKSSEGLIEGSIRKVGTDE